MDWKTMLRVSNSLNDKERRGEREVARCATFVAGNFIN
jgi:hypothetical protein